jgi:hypothetical protein
MPASEPYWWEDLVPLGSSRRRALQRTLGLGLRPVLVASMSRAGSTLLHKSVIGSWAERRFGRHAARMRPFIDEAAWRLDETPLIGGVVYKTHDLPGRLHRAVRPKVLFTYRRASDVAISIVGNSERRPGWFTKARANIRGRGELADLLEADTFGLGRQVEDWSSAEGVEVLGLRYESLWSRVPEIEAFLGFPVTLTPRRTSPKYAPPDPALVEKLRATYADLDRRIDAMPDMFVRS